MLTKRSHLGLAGLWYEHGLKDLLLKNPWSRSACFKIESRWTESCPRSVSRWPNAFFSKEPGTKKFGQDAVPLLQYLEMCLFMVSLRKEQRGERGWGTRGRSMSLPSCLEIQQSLKLLMLLLQRYTVWSSWFSIPGYCTCTICFPVKLLSHRFHVPLRAPQGTVTIPESSGVCLPPFFWGIGTILAISDHK